MRAQLYTNILKKSAPISAFQDPAKMTDGMQAVLDRADKDLPVISLAQAAASQVSNPYKNHAGIDFAVAVGTPVYAPRAGKIWIGPDTGTQGTYLLLILPDGRELTLAHLSRITVRSGVQVKQGDLLGYSGKSGYTVNPSTGQRQPLGAHLHVHVAKDKKVIDAYPLVFDAEPYKLWKHNTSDMRLKMITCGGFMYPSEAEQRLSEVLAVCPELRPYGGVRYSPTSSAGKYQVVLARFEGTLDDAKAFAESIQARINHPSQRVKIIVTAWTW